MSKEHKKAAEHYEVLGRDLANLFDSVNPNRFAVYRTSFLKGTAAGIGGVIGATVGISLLLFVLSFFDNIPFVGEFVNAITNSIEGG